MRARFQAAWLTRPRITPEQVKENMAYLKKMLSQPNTWQQISDSGNG